MKKYVCNICGYVYDEEVGIPDAGIGPKTTWNEIPDSWVCPLCGAAKSDFKEKVEEEKVEVSSTLEVEEEHELKELSFAQMGALCSNLAKGCEKQYLQEESELFTKLANYYKAKAGVIKDEDISKLLEIVNNDLEDDYIKANSVASVKPDRGALRALVWSEKVTRILNYLLNRYEKEKDALLENTNIYVCEICGFIYVGDELPSICPVCKVPNKKFSKIERG